MKTGFIDSENKSRFYVGDGFIETIINGHTICPIGCGGYAKICLNNKNFREICSKQKKNIVLFVSRNHKYPQFDLSVYFETDSYFVKDNFLDSDYKLSLDINKVNEILNLSDSEDLHLFILPKSLSEIQNDLAFNVVAVCNSNLKNIPSRQKVYDDEINEEIFTKLYMLNSFPVGSGVSSNYINYNFNIKDINVSNIQKLLDNNCPNTISAIVENRKYVNQFVQIASDLYIDKKKYPVLARALDSVNIHYNTVKKKPKFQNKQSEKQSTNQFKSKGKTLKS